MTERFLLLALSVAVGWLFATGGDQVLGRRSRSVFDWNESMLVGLSVSSAALFPLSLLTLRHALDCILLLLFASAASRLARSRLKRRARRLPGIKVDIWSALLFGVVAAASLLWILENLRSWYVWDGYQIWATKAMVLYEKGGLAHDFLSRGMTERVMIYPHMTPLLEATLSKIRGRFDFDEVKPVFVLFFFSLALSCYRALRSFTSVRVSLAGVAILLLLPAVSLGSNLGGYADMPQAAVLAGSLCALLDVSRRAAAPWLIGGLTTVKSEGLILWAIASVGVVLYWLLDPAQSLSQRIKMNGRAIVIAALFPFIALTYTHWTRVVDPAYTFDVKHLRMIGANAPQVFELCARQALSPDNWFGLWLLFVVSAPVVVIWGNRLLKVLALSTICSIGASTAIFFFTNWPIPIHIGEAYNRLLEQVTPAALITIIAAFQLTQRSSAKRDVTKLAVEEVARL